MLSLIHTYLIGHKYISFMHIWMFYANKKLPLQLLYPNFILAFVWPIGYRHRIIYEWFVFIHMIDLWVRTVGGFVEKSESSVCNLTLIWTINEAIHWLNQLFQQTKVKIRSWKKYKFGFPFFYNDCYQLCVQIFLSRSFLNMNRWDSLWN